jgi:hypothetical protein
MVTSNSGTLLYVPPYVVPLATAPKPLLTQEHAKPENPRQENTPFYKTYPFIGGVTGLLSGVATGGWQHVHAPDVYTSSAKKGCNAYEKITYALYYRDKARTLPQKGVYVNKTHYSHLNEYEELTLQQHTQPASGEYSLENNTRRITFFQAKPSAPDAITHVTFESLEAVQDEQKTNVFNVQRQSVLPSGQSTLAWHETGQMDASRHHYQPKQFQEHVRPVKAQEPSASSFHVNTSSPPLPIQEKRLAQFLENPATYLSNELPKGLELQPRSLVKSLVGWGAGLSLAGFASGWIADFLSRRHRKQQERRAASPVVNTLHEKA